MSVTTLPSMESTFTIKLKGSNTKQLWEGKFTYKRPNIGTQSEISKTTARLNEDLKNLDEDMQFLHRILSVLKHTLIDAPEWWISSQYGLDLYDTNVIFEIYKTIQDFENEWYNKVWKEEPKPKDKDSKK